MYKDSNQVHSLSFTCIISLFLLFLPASLSSNHVEYKVNPKYDKSYDCWKSTCFSTVTDAINTIPEGGTIHVAPATYNEEIEISKKVNLVGGDIKSTILDNQGKEPIIKVHDTTGVTITGFTFIGDFSKQLNFNVTVRNASDVLITENIFEGGGINLKFSQNNQILKNKFNSQSAIILGSSHNNHISNNEINAHAHHSISLFGNSTDNKITDNVIVGVQNPPCTGVRLVQSSHNYVDNNTLSNFRAHVLLTAADKNIVSNNKISEHWGEGGGIILHRSVGNKLINNSIESIDDGGIILFNASSQNTLKGNSIQNTVRGIGVFFKSNKNMISGNNIADNSKGIIFSDARKNIVFRNNIINNLQQAFDDGNNFWSHNQEGNYWSDHILLTNDKESTKPYLIPSKGVDSYPLVRKIDQESIEVPDPIFTTKIKSYGSRHLEEDRIWKDQTLDVKETIIIENGGSLILENVIIRTSVNSNLFNVLDGGSLKITDSKITSDGAGITTHEGANLHIENSELIGLGLWDAGGILISNDGAVIKNNVIQDSYTGLRIQGDTSNLTLTDNKISNVRYGIQFCCKSSSDNIIKNNEFANVLGKALDLGMLKNSVITGNKFQDVFDYAISLERFSDNNLIYNNFFLNCNSSARDIGSNTWNFENQGNYWGDYKQKYPDAWEHPKYSQVWDTMYEISGIGNKDLYPLMPKQPQMKYNQPSYVSEGKVSIKSDFTTGDYDLVRVNFLYRKVGDTIWKKTEPETFNSSGHISQTLTQLEPGTVYEYKGRIVYNNHTEHGRLTNFYTEKELPESDKKEGVNPSLPSTVTVNKNYKNTGSNYIYVAGAASIAVLVAIIVFVLRKPK